MASRDTSKQSASALPVSKLPAWASWVKTARPFTLAATISPLLVGTSLALYDGTFHVLPFLLALLASLFLQIGTNYFNEYFDYRYDLDSPESLGASTVIYRQEMTAGQVLGGAVGCFVAAALLGLGLVVFTSPVVLLFGLAGMTIAYFYSAKPFKFATRGLGDLLVFLAMGLLMTWGAYYVQIPHWSWRACAASVPVGLLVTAILNMNNVRDYQDDFAVHKRTLPVRFGLTFGKRFHAVLLFGSYLAVTICVIAQALPLTCLAVWLTFPLAFINVRAILTATERRVFALGIKRTAQLHLYFGVVLTLAVIAAVILKAVGI